VELRYNSFLLIAGGSGISSCLSWLTYVTSIVHAKRLETVHLVWVIREKHSLASVVNELRNSIFSTKTIQVHITFYITGSTSNTVLPVTKNEKQIEKDEESQIGTVETSTQDNDTMADIGTVAFGRPNLKTVIETSITTGKKLLVLACGPPGMNADIANACADAQKLVLRGEALEIGLHLEAFDW
jgi:NAD(P)H-flavin reductase